MSPASTPESPGYTFLPDYDDDYQFGMSAAHRKPAYEIGAPSITWRVAFWRPNLVRNSDSDVTSEEATRDYSVNLKEYDEWILQIEHLILHVYDKLKQHRNERFPEGADEDRKWGEPKLSNLQPSKTEDAEYVRLMQRRFAENCPAGGRWTEEGHRLDIPAAKRQYQQTRYEAVHIDGVWESMPLDIRFEVSDEYFTITTTIDFSRMKKYRGMGEERRSCRKGEFADGFEAYEKARAAMFKIISRCNQRRSKMKTTGTPESKNRLIRELRNSSRTLYFYLWEGMKENKYKSIDKFDGLKNIIFASEEAIATEKILGWRFVDFRNLSLQCSKDSDLIVNPWKSVEIDGGKKLVTDPDAWKDKSKRDTVIGHSFENDDLEWVDTIHPILLSIEDKMVNDMASDPVEYTFTKFCNERCIYGSGFGPQIEGSDGGGGPLTYILLFGFDEHRQMGRLVNRLNTLGTLRMSAIHRLRTIKQNCDFHLNDIENDLEVIQKLVSQAFADAFTENKTPGKLKDLWQRPEVVDAKEDTWWDTLLFRIKITWRLIKTGTREPGEWKQFHNSSDEIGARLTKVHDALGYRNVLNEKISEEKKLEGVKESLGWVPMRAWRSNYYRERFAHLSRALNSKLIEGYQPYDVFLEHRLARAYSVIDLVAHHFAELQEKEIRLRKEWMALRAHYHQEEFASGQTVAEVFFFLVLLPYYAHHSVVAIYGWFHPAALSSTALLQTFTDRALTICVVISTLLLCLFRPRSINLFVRDALRALLLSLRMLISALTTFIKWVDEAAEFLQSACV